MAYTHVHAAVAVPIMALPIPLWIKLPLCFISHFIMDKYPEWYPDKSSKVSIIDQAGVLIPVSIVICFYEIFYLSHRFSWGLIAGMFLANLPDLIDFFNRNKKEKFFFCHASGYQLGKFESWECAVFDTVICWGCLILGCLC